MAKKEQQITKKEKNKKVKSQKDKTSFFKGFKAELKKVNWPSAKQLVNNTLAVIVIVLILTAIVFVLDLAFEAVNKYGLDKIKESVVSSSESQISDEATDENTEQTSNESNTSAEENAEPTDTTTTENQETSTEE